ncbi:MAG: cytochrome c [Bacteroidetes bacterium]|nr:cytochrome c [Bacteroidota bacterium]
MRNLKENWRFRISSKPGMIVLIIIAIGLFYKCGTVKHVPAPPVVAKTTINNDTLMAGKTLYVNNCQKCHKLYSPDAYNAAEWKDNLNAMQRKAKISDAQKETIYKYLTANIKK